ncbi:hypothetical protein [Wenyingzhuangia sp. 2_MG-2023]|uniref:hypothetical protein n=1 Tax=Wenyingzhuangia sp. 2_MG-2023 TaxID=3062639 RepID=UPI0026E22F84|nr:hypothetical protein [Wenyingzhuangia sp. 2_MG-2023]MDO6736843.1 hypothetical protein [Wenyingzhuangia sp. 2_MG-2023]
MKNVILVVTTLFTLMMYGCMEDERQPSAIAKEDPDTISRDSTKAIYRQFFFSGSHNSYSGNLSGMKREGIKTQLEQGLRFFEFDLFTYNTENKMQISVSEVADVYTVFELQETSHLLSYTNNSGELRIQKLIDGASELVLETTLESGARSFTSLTFENKEYLMSFHDSSKKLTMYRIENTKLELLFSTTMEMAEASLSTFVFKEKAYIMLYDNTSSKSIINEISFEGTKAVLGKEMYQMSSVVAGVKMTPFVQKDVLYVFQHSDNSVASFLVDKINTTSGTWSVESSVRGSSDLLKGNVQAVHKENHLYVNSYAANGDVIGAQLVMDQEKPNLVFEYSNSEDMISGANASVFPATKGYYLFLQKGLELQMNLITIGVLTLGHDEPGDAVDLSVDNPNSIFLADWIAYIANWSDEHPYHEPLFIMTELKEYQQWMADAKWRNIIELMQENFGEKLRYHSSNGFKNEDLVDESKIVDGETLYFMDENGDKEQGLLGKVILYIQPNNNITKSAYTNDFIPFETVDGELQANFLQLKRYRENNKLVSPDWRKPGSYGNDFGDYIDQKDNSYISRIFHMESSLGDSQYDNIQCTNVMFGVSDRPFDKGLYSNYISQQKIKNTLEQVLGCD